VIGRPPLDAHVVVEKDRRDLGALDEILNVVVHPQQLIVLAAELGVDRLELLVDRLHLLLCRFELLVRGLQLLIDRLILFGARAGVLVGALRRVDRHVELLLRPEQLVLQRLHRRVPRLDPAQRAAALGDGTKILECDDAQAWIGAVGGKRRHDHRDGVVLAVDLDPDPLMNDGLPGGDRLLQGGSHDRAQRLPQDPDQAEGRDAAGRLEIPPGLAPRETHDLVLPIDHEIGGGMLLENAADALLDTILDRRGRPQQRRLRPGPVA
jgi:hypothetical protein